MSDSNSSFDLNNNIIKNGNIKQAAESLGVSVDSLKSKIY